MKRYRLYALRDRIADRFRSVTVDVNDMVAKRNFAYALNNAPELLWEAKDLELCMIAEFDDVSGVVYPETPIQVVCRGDEVVQEK